MAAHKVLTITNLLKAGLLQWETQDLGSWCSEQPNTVLQYCWLDEAMLAYVSNFAQMMPAALSPDLALRLATNSMISSEPRYVLYTPNLKSMYTNLCAE